MGRVGPPGHAYVAPRHPRVQFGAREPRVSAPLVLAAVPRSRWRPVKQRARRTGQRPLEYRFPPRWTLTAPESYMLHWAGTGVANDLDAFRLGLQELVLRGALRVEQTWICGRTRRWHLEWLYSWGPHKGDTHASALMPLLALHARAWQRGHWVGYARDDHDIELAGVRFKDLMYARSFWRASWHGYLNGPVAAALQRRDMLKPDRTLTGAGRDAEQQLERWLRLGKQAAGTRGESWARAYLAGAGAAALLLPGSLPVLARIHGVDPNLNIAAFDAGPGWLGALGDLGGGDCGGCDGGGG